LTEDFSRAGTAGALLERDDEVAELGRVIAGVARGSGVLAVIEGEAGIGKTRLFELARERGAAQGVRVLSARGGELERDFGFGIVRQLFEGTLAGADAGARATMLDGAAGLAAPLFAAAPGDASSDGDPSYAILHGLFWLVANLAEADPVILAIDDAQWADPPSLRFLDHLGRRLDGVAAAVLLCVRSGEGGDPEGVLDALRLGAASILRPKPLSEAAVADLVRGSFGPATTDGLCRACHAASAGNPFLVNELVRELDDRATSGAEPDPLVVRELGPERIATAVLSRVRRLSESAPALARGIAVLGAGAELRLAAQLSAIDDAEARRLTAALVDVAVLAPGAEPLRFVHPVVRGAIYADIPVTERAALHAAAARLLGVRGAAPEEIAVHLLASEPAGVPERAETLAVAARLALARGAPESAARYLRRALEEPPPAQARPMLLQMLGGALLGAGDPAGVARLRDAFEASPPGVARAVVTLTLVQVLLAQGRLEEAIERIEQAIAELPTSERELRLELESQLATAARLGASTYGQGAERLRPLAAEARGETPAERMLLGCLALQALFDGASAEQVGVLAESAIALALPDERSLSSPCIWDPLWALVVAERYTSAERHLRFVLARARKRAALSTVTLASGFVAFLELGRGRLQEAEAAARTALEVSRVAGFGPGTSMNISGSLIRTLLERDEPAMAAQELDAARIVDAEIPDTIFGFSARHDRGVYRLTRGDLEGGVADLRHVHDRIAAGYGLNAWALPFLGGRLAVAVARCGGATEARALAEEELALARLFGAPRALGVALRAAGLVERGGRQIELLTEAVATLESSEARVEHARALIDLGVVLRRGGREAEARERLTAGMDLAHRYSAVALAEQARDELIASGARPRRLARTGVEALTSSERRVALMACEGMTNKEIAQALFVTLRTVEMHLSNVYAKLEIKGRRELAAAIDEPAS
jgi:DNA-binding CsgD family transcriptional regulator